jgi:hypothetical protein
VFFPVDAVVYLAFVILPASHLGIVVGVTSQCAVCLDSCFGVGLVVAVLCV